MFTVPFVAVACLGFGPSTPPVRWGPAILRQKPEWYASAEARAAAGRVIRYQSPEGGWPKNHDLLAPPASDTALAELQKRSGNTIDNGATTTPIRFLALVATATGDAKCRESFTKGVDYLLAAPYANGGWPQFFPLRPSYHSRITFNDGAMIGVMTLLREVAGGTPPFALADKARRDKAAEAVAKGIDCILKSQVRQHGALTAWCAQHDERTLAPARARAYEGPSLSGSESVGIVRFLLGVENPSPDVIAAVDGAAAWFRAVAIKGVRLETFTNEKGERDRRVVPDPAAAALWARFYELGTNRPIFTGRDTVVKYAFAEIERERRTGYAYYGTWPATFLEKDYPAWKAKQK
jgi:PelA/Pel-15E family pectate lyase